MNSIFAPKPEATSPGSFTSPAGIGAGVSLPPSPPFEKALADASHQATSSPTDGVSPAPVSPSMETPSSTPSNGTPLPTLAPGTMLSGETPTPPLNLSFAPADPQTSAPPSSSSTNHDSTRDGKPSAQDQTPVPPFSPILMALALLAGQNPTPILPPTPTRPLSQTSTPSPDQSTESPPLLAAVPGPTPLFTGDGIPTGQNIPSPETILPSASSPATPPPPDPIRTPASALKQTSAKTPPITPTASPFSTFLQADLSTSNSAPVQILAQTSTQDQFGMLRAANTGMAHTNPTPQMMGSQTKSLDFLIPESGLLTSAFQTGDSGLAPAGGQDVREAASPEQLPETIRSFLQTAIPSLPRRVEIHLATPEGARVTLFIARSNGELRAQLSTSDPTVLQWLQQQVHSLRQTQWGAMVNWLPPQREDGKPSGENPRNMENRRRAPRHDETTFAAWSPTDVTEPTLITRR